MCECIVFTADACPWQTHVKALAIAAWFMFAESAVASSRRCDSVESFGSGDRSLDSLGSGGSQVDDGSLRKRAHGMGKDSSQESLYSTEVSTPARTCASGHERVRTTNAPFDVNNGFYTALCFHKRILMFVYGTFSDITPLNLASCMCLIGQRGGLLTAP